MRKALLLLNIMVNYSHVGWQLAAIISILYMVWASSVHPVLPFSAHSVPHQSCISVNMIGSASPTPCMPYVAMVQASTITKKLHKITLHHTTLSYQPMLHAPVHHKCSFDSRSSSKALFQCIVYMSLPMATVKETVDCMYLLLLRLVVYSHDYIALQHQYWLHNKQCNMWQLLASGIMSHAICKKQPMISSACSYLVQKGGGIKKIHSVEQWSWRQLQPYVLNVTTMSQSNHLPEECFVFTSYCKMEDM